MKAIGLVPLALLAACRGGALAPAPPGDADTDAGEVADGGGATPDVAPDVAPDVGPPSLYQPAPATGGKSLAIVPQSFAEIVQIVDRTALLVADELGLRDLLGQ